MHYNSDVSDSTPVMIRLAKSFLPRLDSAAKRMGTNRSAMMKFLLKTFLDKFERGGFSALPHDWENIMHDLDGRTYGQQQSQSQSLRAAETPGDPPAPKKVRDGKYPTAREQRVAGKKTRKKSKS